MIKSTYNRNYYRYICALQVLFIFSRFFADEGMDLKQQLKDAYGRIFPDDRYFYGTSFDCLERILKDFIEFDSVNTF